MEDIRVLFVCIHNSARSQMAEALLKVIGGKRFMAESAGLEPGTLNPFAVRAMKEIGIDISGNKTKSVFEFFKQGRLYSHVITVCDEAQAEQCPLFPGGGKKLHWSFPDPSRFEGTDKEILKKTIEVRDMIRKKIEEWVKDLA
jgi:arsenate reductase (thioredoxin)